MTPAQAEQMQAHMLARGPASTATEAAKLALLAGTALAERNGLLEAIREIEAMIVAPPAVTDWRAVAGRLSAARATMEEWAPGVDHALWTAPEGSTEHMGMALLETSADLPVYGRGVYGGSERCLSLVRPPEGDAA